MKSFLLLVLFWICAAVSGGDENSGGGETRVCPSEAVDRTKQKLYKPVTSLGMRCIQQVVRNETFDKLTSTMQLEEVRAFYRAFCQTRSSIKNCFQELTSNLEVCQNEKFVNAFQIFQDFWKELTQFGCQHEGGYFSILFHGAMRAISNATTNLPFGNCMWKSSVIIKEIENTDIDYPSKFFLLSQEVTKLKTCFHKVDLEPNFKTVLESAIDNVLHKLNCIQPVSGSLVLCKDIDRPQIKHPDSCEVFFGGKKSEEKKQYDLYGEGTSNCFKQLMTLDEKPNNITENIRSMRRVIEAFCVESSSVSYCILRKSIFSYCFTSTQQNELQMLEYFITDAMNILCAHKGNRIANIMFEVYRLKKALPGRRNVISDCVTWAKEATKKRLGHEYETSSMRFYFVLGRFKECFLNWLRGDETAHRDAQWLLEELLSTAECVHPLSNVKVICSTFVNNQI